MLTGLRERILIAVVAVLVGGAVGYRLLAVRPAPVPQPVSPQPAAQDESEISLSTTTETSLEEIQEKIAAWKERLVAANTRGDEFRVATLTDPMEPSAPVVPPSVHVPILTYHSTRFLRKSDTRLIKYFDVAPNIFGQQMKYLKDNGYTSISFDALVEAIAGTTTLPEKPVIISFDDGWRNQYLDAFPILKKFGFTATFFVWTRAIGHHRNFMTWDQLKEMHAAGMHIASHTLTHQMLNRIRDEVVLRRQIFESKKIIEEKLGAPVTVFAYPYGLYNARVVALVKAAGYVAARGVYSGTTHSVADLYTLRTIIATSDMAAFTRALEQE